MNRTRVLLLLLAVVAIAGAAFFYLRGSSPVAPLAMMSDENLREFEKMRAAEKIGDPVERCLAYPDLAEFHWDRKVVEAFCRLGARKMISWKEMSTALDEHHPEVLDEAFKSYLEKTYHKGDHGFLIWTYWWMFENASEQQRDFTQRWVEADPQSAFALTARGIHYVAAAGAARGDKFIRDTPKEISCGCTSLPRRRRPTCRKRCVASPG